MEKYKEIKDDKEVKEGKVQNQPIVENKIFFDFSTLEDKRFVITIFISFLMIAAFFSFIFCCLLLGIHFLYILAMIGIYIATNLIAMFIFIVMTVCYYTSIKKCKIYY